MNKILVVVGLLVACGSQAEEWGHFVGPVQTKWAKDGRSMIMIENFTYVGPDEVKWVARKGSSIDGASIPLFAWSIIGPPYVGQYRKASVIHDVACDEQARPWKDVHRAFYTAMRADGVGVIKAKIMYAAVYHFGPRWPARIELPKMPVSKLGAKLLSMELAEPGTEITMMPGGERIGDPSDPEAQEIVGAMIELNYTQLEFSEEAFNDMQGRIKAEDDISLEEIEHLLQPSKE